MLFSFNLTFRFFPRNEKEQARKGDFYGLHERRNRFWIYLVFIEIATLLPKRKQNRSEEIKQDGLLMLEFSYSQSSKDFTTQ